MRRRTMLIGGVSVLMLGGLATCVFWPEDEAEQGLPVTLGFPRLIPPLVRATIAGQDRVFMLVRRTETENNPNVPPGTGWRGERLEIRAYDAATLAPIFAAPVISGRTGGFRTAGLIGEQAATIWLYGDALGAVSAVDGQVFLGGEGFAAVTPQLGGAFNQARDTYRMEEALVFAFLGARYRMDPRSFAATPAPERDQGVMDAAFPPPARPALFGAGGPAAFRVAEALLDDAWFGLPLAAGRPNDGQPQGAERRFLPASLQPDTRGAPQRLWRAGIRRGVAPMAAESGSFQSSGRGDPAPGDRLLLDRPTEVATTPATLQFAGFLTAGTAEPLRPAGAPGLLLLQQPTNAPPSLTRLGADGRALWTTMFGFPRLISVLPGESTLVLVGQRGSGTTEQDVITSIALADGQARELVLNFGSG
ncbi:hypothetical protein GXW71_19735 [Roseomonas hellenica]|uniref:Uncharacterized protein n=1 Tax=Plastoroseomonas hellenica TaxID=2687306 RepID=A0ABS5F391_9PROT|nr:hypothetical protein [Plastoroseomonas hellenica]MBR0666600.1 hypothetical protein [Plastoroseomonas hellenica]